MTFEPWFFTDISILFLIESMASWSLLAERTRFGPASVIRSTNCAAYSFFIHAMTGSWTLPSIQLIAVTNLPVCISHHPSPASVSYTHLRAHETRHDLVCRLLLEKKKKKKPKDKYK